jgi:hypothetical protein
VVVEHPVGDGVDAEALEHPEADLRVALQHHPLRLGERPGLAQYLLGDRELAEVVQACGQARELDVLLRQPEAPGHTGRELGDALRMAAGVDVAGVHGPREAGGRSEAGGAVGPAGQSLQLRELDHVRPICAHAVLSVLLRPVERAVGEPDQLVAVGRMRRRGRNPRAHGDWPKLVELQR